MPQQVIGGRYVVGDTIGTGGMGEVIEAKDEVLGRNVALKVLKPELAADEQTVERFRREARIAASLSHPAIAHVYDFAEAEGRSFIIMERLEGRDLHKMLAEAGTLDPVDAAEITAAVADGLEHAHKRGAVHRDVKPGNIFITESGEVKVTDFGIAIAAGQANLTATGGLVGTPTYLSPEQVSGGRSTARSDIYSLGCVLFECLTGRPPFEGESSIAIAMARTSSTTPRLREVDPELPEELEQIVAKATERDPQKRFASAGEMAEALRRFTSGARSAGGAVAAAVASGAAGAAAPTIAGSAQATSVLVDERPPPTDVVEVPLAGRTPKRALFIVGALVVLVLALIALASAVDRASTPETRSMPAVTGKSLDDATEQLEEIGLEVASSEQLGPPPSGVVITQDPVPGALLKEGDEVKLVVSDGKAATVPEVVGKKEQEARQALEAAGFVAEVAGFVKDGEKDTVVSQDPGANAVVAKGSTVRLTISSGEEEGKGEGGRDKGKKEDD